MELRNVFVLGISFMFLFAAFQTSAMIQPVVLDSARNASNGTFTGNGYTSLAIIYGSFAVFNWLSPPVVYFLGPKWSMIIGAVIYNFYVSTFLFLSTWLLYAASFLVGAGAAVVWTAQGNFLTINSNEETITRNTGIFWALLQCSTIFGNLFVYFEFKGLVLIEHRTRMAVYTGLTVVGVVGMSCMLFMKKTVSERFQVETGVVEAFKKATRLLKNKHMLLLCPIFFYTGLGVTFVGGVFVTSVGHTIQFGKDAKDLVGVCGIMCGVGEMFGGLFFGMLGKRATKHGRGAVVLFGFMCNALAFFMIFLDLSEESPIENTRQTSYIPANRPMTILSGLMLGLGDSCINTQIYSLLGVIYTNESSAAFAIFKFMQAIAAMTGFFYSSRLMLEWQLLLLATSSTIGVLCFFWVETSLRMLTGHSSRPA